MEKLLRVLIIEDSENDADLLVRELRRGGYEVESERVETGEAMRAALAQKTWDLILSDYKMPRFDATRALKVLHASGLDLPFIIVSGTISEETAVISLKAGAHDFLAKEKLARLIPAIQRELKDAEARRERRLALEALRESEERYRLLFESNPNPMWVYDLATLQILAVNDAAVEHYGYSRTEFLSMTIKEIRPDEDVPALMAALTENQDELHVPAVWRHRKKDGTLIDVEISSHSMQWAGRPTRVVLVNDVTERMRAEIRIKTQLERFASLHAIDTAISSSTDLHMILYILLNQAITRLKVDAADILLYNRVTNMLEVAAAQGFQTAGAQEGHIRMGQEIAGRAAYERTILKGYFAAREGASLVIPRLADEGFTWYCAVPLISKGKTTGVFEVFEREHQSHDRDWMDFLNMLAGQTAIAVDNAMLFNSLQRSNEDLRQAYDATIEGWSRALDLRDRETEGHTQRVTELTLDLSGKFGFPEEEFKFIRWGALLHDIGKMGVPDSILLKPASLTEKEWEIMKKHPNFAFQMLSPILYLQGALDIPYCHHEKWDGSGYPRGLRGGEIPLTARIFAVVDVWDALRSDRPYRRAWSAAQAREYIHIQAGSHFDPKVVEYFLPLI